MTFLEAAIEVLRREGTPLHYDKITEIAVKLNLLSHVGKNPEATMASRLALQTRVARPDSSIVKVKPGVFSLSEWKGNPPGPKRAPKVNKKEEMPPKTGVKEQENVAKSSEKSAKAIASAKKREKDEKKRKTEQKKTAAKNTSGEKSKKRASSKTTVKSQVDKNLYQVALPELIENLLRASKKKSKKSTPKELLKDVSKQLGRKEEKFLLHMLKSSLFVDNTRKRLEGSSPLFHEDHKGAYSLENEKPQLLSLETHLLQAAKEYYGALIKEMGDSLAQLEEAPLVNLISLVLERLEFGQVTLVNRSSKGNLLLLARSEQSLAKNQFLVFLRRTGPKISPAEIEQFRDNFVLYGAQGGLLISWSGFEEGAYPCAAKKGTLPVSLFDANSFAECLVRTKVGVSENSLPFYRFDSTFFTTLKN